MACSQKTLHVTIILLNGWFPLSLGISHHESTYIMSIRIAADWKETLQNQNAGVRSVMTWEGFLVITSQFASII